MGSYSASTNTSTTSNLDKRQVVDGNAIGVSSDTSTVHVSVLDDGAVRGAIRLAENSGAGFVDAYKALLSVTLALDSKNSDVATANNELAAKLADAPDVAGLSEPMKLGGLVLLGILALAFLRK